MNQTELAAVVSKIESAGLFCKVYPNNYLINVTDTDGVIQSYYASTGTAIFRDGNDKFKSQKHTEHGMTADRFIALCKGEEDIQEIFF